MSVPYFRDATAATLRFSSPGRWYATSVSLPLLGRSFGTMTRLEQQTMAILRTEYYTPDNHSSLLEA